MNAKFQNSVFTNLLAQKGIKEAIDYLESCQDINQQGVIHLKSRYNDLLKRELKGIVKDEDRTLEENKIRALLLKLSDGKSLDLIDDKEKSTSKYLLGLIPNFFSNFIEIIQAPKKFINSNKVNHEEAFRDSFIFLGISLIITYLIKSPYLSKGTSFEVFNYILKDGLWKIFIIFLLSISMSLSWKIQKVEVSARKFMIYNGFFFGVFTIIIHLIFSIVFVANKDDHYRPFSSGLILMGYLYIIWWIVTTWKSYLSTIERTKLQFMKSAFIFGTIGIPAIFLAVILRDVLILGDVSYLTDERIFSIVGRFFHYTIID